MKLYQAIALNANPEDNPYFNLQASIRQKRIEALLPSGAGFNNGTTIEAASNDQIVFRTPFHHMNEHGHYCGYTDHKIIVRPSLGYGFTVKVTGENIRGIKDYIQDMFIQLIDAEFEWINPVE